MSSRQKSSRPEVQFSPPRSARQSKPKPINGSSSERRRPHLSHSQGDVVINGDRHHPSGGPALHNQEVAHPRDRRQDWAQNHNHHDAVHDNGYRYCEHSPLGYERVYLPLCKVADTPFHIQRYCKNRSFGYKRMYLPLHKVADTTFHIQRYCKIVPLDMKGCSCHFAKWQMHHFISKGRNASYV